jgi:hypothetical protein
MSKCKHNRLPERVKGGSLPRDEKEYYCTQCQAWVPAEPINREVDKRVREEQERMAALRGKEG